MDFTVCIYICVHLIGIPSISTETSERVTLIMADGLTDFTHPVDMQLQCRAWYRPKVEHLTRVRS